MAGRTPRERAVEFRFLRSARPRLARACAHLILSHAPTDRPLTQAEWAQAVELALSKKGASGVAFVAFQHPPDADHDHDHVHVIYCRVKPDGAVVSDSNSYKANTRAARSIERTLRLAPLPRVHLKRKVGDRQAVANAVRRAVRRGTLAPAPAEVIKRAGAAEMLKAINWTDLQGRLLKAGIEARQLCKADGSVQGWAVRLAGAEEWLKASTVHRSLSWKNVHRQLARNARDQAAAELEAARQKELAAERAARARPVAVYQPERPPMNPAAPTTHAPAPHAATAEPAGPPDLLRELRACDELQLQGLQRYAAGLPMRGSSAELRSRLADLLRRLIAILFGWLRGQGRQPPSEATGRAQIAAAVAAELERRATEAPRGVPTIEREAAIVRRSLHAAESNLGSAVPEAQLAAEARRRAEASLALHDLRARAARAAETARAAAQAAPGSGLAARLSGAARRHAETLAKAEKDAKTAAAAIARAERQLPEVTAEALAALKDEIATLQRDVDYWRARALRLEAEAQARRIYEVAAGDGEEASAPAPEPELERDWPPRQRGS